MLSFLLNTFVEMELLKVKDVSNSLQPYGL